MTNKKGAPFESAGEPGDPSNFKPNNTLFVRKLQALALLVSCLVGSGAAFWLLYLAGIVIGGLLS